MEERSQRDWEAKKKRVFEELGGRVAGGDRALSEMRGSVVGKSTLAVSSGTQLMAEIENIIVFCRPKPFSAYANKNDGIRPRRHRIERCKTKRDVLPYCSLPH